MRGIYLVLCMTLNILHSTNGQSTNDVKPRRRFEIPSFMDLFTDRVINAPVTDQSQSPDGTGNSISIVSSDQGQPGEMIAIELNPPVEPLVTLPGEPININADSSPGIDPSSWAGTTDASGESSLQSSPVDTAIVVPATTDTSAGNSLQTSSSSNTGSLGPGSRRSRRPRGKRPKRPKNKRKKRPKSTTEKPLTEGPLEQAPLPGSTHKNEVPLDNLNTVDTGLIHEQPVGTPSNVHEDIPISSGEPFRPFHDIPLQDINLGALGTMSDTGLINEQHEGTWSNVHTDVPLSSGVQFSPGHEISGQDSNLGALGTMSDTGLINEQPEGTPSNVHADVPLSGGVQLSPGQEISGQHFNLGELGALLTSINLNAPGAHSDPINGPPMTNTGEQQHIHSNPSINGGNPVSLGNDGIMLGTGLNNEQLVGTPSNVHVDVPGSRGEHFGPVHDIPLQDINDGGLGTHFTNVDLNAPGIHNDPINSTPGMHNGQVDIANVVPSDVDTSTGILSKTTSSSNTGSLGPGSRRPRRPRGKQQKRPKNKRQKRPKNKAEKHPTGGPSEPAILPGSILQTEVPHDNLNTVGTDNTAFGPPSDVRVDVPISSTHEVVHDTSLQDINLGKLGTHLTSDGTMLDTGLINEQPVGTPSNVHEDIPISGGEPFGPFHDIPLQDINLGALGTMSDTGLINEQPVGTPSNVHTDVPLSGGVQFSPGQEISGQHFNLGELGALLTSINLNAPGAHSDPINGPPMTNTGEQQHIHSNPSINGGNPVSLGNDGIMLGTGLNNEQPVGTPSNVHVDVPGSRGEHFGPVHDIPLQDINHGGLGTHLTSVDLNLPDKNSNQISGAPSMHSGQVDKANVVPANVDTSTGILLKTISSSNTSSLGPGSERSRRPRGKRPKRPKNKRQKRPKNKRQKRPKNKPKKRPKDGLSEPVPPSVSILKTAAPFDNINTVGTDKTAFGPNSEVHVGAPIFSSQDIVRNKPRQDINLGKLGTHLTNVDLNAPDMHSDPINGTPMIHSGEKPHIHSKPTKHTNLISIGSDGIVTGSGLTSEHSSEHSRQPNSLHQTEHSIHTAFNQIDRMLTPAEQVSAFASGKTNPNKPLGALFNVHAGTADVGLGGSVHVQHGNQNIDVGQSKARSPVNLNTHSHQSAGDTNFGTPRNDMIRPIVPGYHRNREMFARPDHNIHSPPVLGHQQLFESVLGIPTSASQRNNRRQSILTHNGNVRESHRSGGQHLESQRRGGRRRGGRRRGGWRRGSRLWGRGRNGRRRWRNNFQNDHLQIDTTTPLISFTTTTTVTPVPRHHRNERNRMPAPNQNIFHQAGQILHSALTGRGSPERSLLNSLAQTAVGAIGGYTGRIRGHGQAHHPRAAVHRRPTMHRGVLFG